ncbi:Rv1733c family protein [Kitasatospora cinereorecta]|uniref:Membrane protein SCJ1.26 n=1 Tax=Kitasatospora cinereorecta TaxID=285560 RepID=A0ABW0V2N7_9ACTN
MSAFSKRVNPLRRSSDRFQWWLGRILLAVVLVGLPVAAAAAGLQSYRAEVHAGRAQSAARHTVTAHLTADAVDSAPQVVSKVPVTASWTAADGTTRTTTVRIWPGVRAGTPVVLWVDGRDAVTSAPVTGGQAVTAGLTTAAVTAGSVAVVCLAAWKGSVRLLDRGRYARWDAEWSLVEPRWSKRLPN